MTDGGTQEQKRFIVVGGTYTVLMNILHEMAGLLAQYTTSVSNVEEQIYDME